MLGDATGFGVGDTALADAVDERRLTVVDVAKEGDGGGTGDEVLVLDRVAGVGEL